MSAKITATEKTLRTPSIDRLFQITDQYNGISLFSAGTENDHEITGINPVITLLEDRIIKGRDESLFTKNSNKSKKIDPLDELDQLIKQIKDLPPEISLLGYISYDYKDRLEEKNLYKTRKQKIYPDFYFVLFEHYIISSRKKGKATLFTLNFPFEFKHCHLAINTITPPTPFFPVLSSFNKKSIYKKTSHDRKAFASAVEKTKEYIRDGEIYQANITRVVFGETLLSPVQSAINLYLSNRIEYGVFAKIPGGHIIGTSPELLFKKEGRKITTSPIKGTIERGTKESKLNQQQNENIRDQLFNSEKDRAELTMIVDLLRNDLSGVCKPGTVKVHHFPLLMKLSNVYHLYADITGDLISSKIAPIIRTIFPGGSISGCPKIRSCQIIDEIEDAPRGIYTGSFGKINSKGDGVFNIMIRTLFQQGDQFFYHVGGGITLLSDPIEEFKETVSKGKNIQEAINLSIQDQNIPTSPIKKNKEKENDSSI